jgi:hypothetical protein
MKRTLEKELKVIEIVEIELFAVMKKNYRFF